MNDCRHSLPGRGRCTMCAPEISTPNLDCMSLNELVEFITTVRTDQQCREIAGAAPNGAPRRGVEDQIREYARVRRHAVIARLAGRIDRALTLESRLDGLYQRLPQECRW